MAAALLTIHDALITFGNKPLFDDLSLNIHERSKICLIGKNGAGKTTLMSMITGDRELDSGRRWVTHGLTIGYLKQNVVPKKDQTVYDFIFSALGPERQNDDYSYMVDMVAEPLELNLKDQMDMLSGGQLRRASLAYALVEDPDLLLLDEPTNHLDLQGIEWLESYLNSYQGSFICISHDKRFLENISNKIFWLDRGRIRVCPEGFKKFAEWSEMLIEQERRELENRQRNLSLEVDWASRGVKARRKRNVRRVDEMKKERESLKEDKSSFFQAIRKAELPALKADMASKVQAEFIKVSKSFESHGLEKKILDQFSLRVMHKDRIGLLGKNGSGKTTFLKLLMGELEPDMGKVKLGHNLTISYFDQKRAELDPKKSLWDTMCPNGGDYIEVNGKARHVCGYLKDFMFDPKIAHSLVGTLSGGQQNRLMLAKVLANPGSFLILDEPTNDLDMDTLELLEDILVGYKGTLFVVSHDRDFLDQTVNKIIAFEGDGKIDGYIGGYSDYLAEVSGAIKQKTKKIEKPKEDKHKAEEVKPKVKLSYKLQYELDNIPGQISKLEVLITGQKSKIGKVGFYDENPDEFTKTSMDLAHNQHELTQLETRWLELTELVE